MIPPKESREVVSGGARSSVQFGISAKDTGHIMVVLRDQLYSDKVMAVLREYAANAWDANREAGRPDEPIEVTLPTLDDLTLRIRDRGPGLSTEDVETVYSQYGASTKRDSNAAVGMIGIGSKAGFAYSDSFTVVSCHGGFRRTYVAVLDNSAGGRIDLLAEEELRCGCGGDHVASICPKGHPPETGVEIQIAVRPQDLEAFEDRAKRLFSHFRPQPRINCELPEPIVGREIPDLGVVQEGTNKGKRWIAVMGCVPYEVVLDQLDGEVEGFSLEPMARRQGGLLPFGIGDLQVAASREGLKYGDSTKLALIKRINGLLDEYVRTMLDGLDQLSGWEQRLRIRAVDELGMPVPKHLKALDERFVQIDKIEVDGPDGKVETVDVPRTFRVFGFDRWRKRMHPNSYVHVNRGVKLLIKDTPRSIKGYDLSDDSPILVPTEGKEIWELAEELEGWLKRLGLDGLPSARMSTLAWTKPVSASGPRDAERARARCFVLDAGSYRRRQASSGWQPTEIVPSDEDVFVVLDKYRPRGFHDNEGFWSLYKDDRDVLKAIGRSMPPIIGYKSTRNQHISQSSLKGTEYTDWRAKVIPQILAADPKVMAFAQSIAWARLRGAADNLDAAGTAAQLGADHPLSSLVREAKLHHSGYGQGTYDEMRAANRVVTSLGSNTDAARAWAEIERAYPLLGKYGLEGFQEHPDDWIEYVKMVDRGRMAVDNQEREEAA